MAVLTRNSFLLFSVWSELWYSRLAVVLLLMIFYIGCLFVFFPPAGSVDGDRALWSAGFNDNEKQILFPIVVKTERERCFFISSWMLPVTQRYKKVYSPGYIVLMFWAYALHPYLYHSSKNYEILYPRRHLIRWQNWSLTL